MVIDLNTEAFIFGENRLTIEKSVPIITKQPQNVTLISGNDARFSVEAIGAVRYEWEIFDVEDETQQPIPEKLYWHTALVSTALKKVHFRSMALAPGL